LLAIDFVNVWTAGQHALNGHPAAAYNEAVHKAAQVVVLGRDFEATFPWYYPPTFFFPATLLALVPYVPAFLLWVSLTFAAYVAVMRGIIGSNIGILLACAYPGVMMNLAPGQNGFLTAALFGGALLTMQQRPLLCGLLLGLLSFKPQLGLLIPIALIASSRWKVIIAAATTTVALNAASLFVFGQEAWQAFFPTLQAASREMLTEGLSGWGKLHSIYGLARLLGGSDALGWSLQATLLISSAIATFVIWRSNASFETKAAALVTAALLSTPYVFIYDLVILAVPMAFLVRAGALKGFLNREALGLEVVCLMIAAFPVLAVPVGFAATLLVAALIARRMLVEAGEPLPDALTLSTPAWSGTPKPSGPSAVG
jgi:hypothetical protein